MNEIASLLARAETRLRARAFRDAHTLCLEALRLDPNCAEAFYLLALLTFEHDNFTKAAELFGRAIAIAPEPARYHAHLAKTYVRLRREVEALTAAEAAAARHPDDALTMDTVGVAFSYLGLHERALPFFEEAVSRAPGNAMFQHNLGVSAQFSGDFDRAERAFRAELALTGTHRRPYAALAQLRRQSREENYIAELEAQFATETDKDGKLQIGHALAKTYEDLGDYDAALAWLQRAKTDKLAQFGDRTEQTRALFAAARGTFEHTPTSNNPDDAPIFVVGMPRTGTTLVDRILSSHPEATSAGELGHFGQLAVQMAASFVDAPMTEARLMAATSRIDVAALGRAYIAAARRRVGPSGRFIDKMPANVLYAGLIHRALPNARIICLRRDPVDTCLSNYRQGFNAEAEHYWYTYGLESTARYYALFADLASHWRAALPANRYMEIRYEAIVEDLEGAVRNLLSFCNLDWDPRCLAFHQNRAAVATASSVQVRAPIYSSSVGRWRRYGDGLQPLLDELRKCGVAVA